MRIIRPSGEAEMISEFLKAEIDSNDFNQNIWCSIKLGFIRENEIRDPNINNHSENLKRSRVLGYSREFPAEGIFKGLRLDSASWNLAVVDVDDMSKILGVTGGFWDKASGGTRLLKDIANNFSRNSIDSKVWSEPLAKLQLVLAESLKGNISTKPILLEDKSTNRLLALEGHSRLTVNILQKLAECEVFIGSVSDVSTWKFDKKRI